MKKLILLLLACLVANSAFAAMGPFDSYMGLYFDTNASQRCYFGPASVPFDVYLILTNTTAPSINAYELGLDVEVPAGMEGMVFRLASTIANGVVSGVDVGTNGPLGGDFIVGLAAPIPSQPAMVLHYFQYMLLSPMIVHFYIGASSAPSIPGDLPVVQNAEGSILMQVLVSSGSPDYPVASVNEPGCGTSATEEVSFGSVKSLYR
ncbi:MAG: hypothetical protein ABFS42_00425 [Candidatus Krumholzibacteriota bacterium]